MQIRRDNLEDALIHYRLLRDIEEEITWINDKELLIKSHDFGTSLHSVQALQNKHQASYITINKILRICFLVFYNFFKNIYLGFGC